MAKFFNTAGLCLPDEHYMVDPLKRLPGVRELIERSHYFIIYAPPNSGKTTYVRTLSRCLNREGEYIALAVSFEKVGEEDISISIDKANDRFIDCIYQAAMEQLPEFEWPANPVDEPFRNLYNYLHHWCGLQKKPIVLLIDEFDVLIDDVYISTLSQLRDGFQARPKYFPSTIALVGRHDIKDYKRYNCKNYRSGKGSPFKVTAESLLLENFSKGEVFQLLGQHTGETGQEFSLEVKEEIFNLTGGQPWLTNALADQIVSRILGGDTSKKINLSHVAEAKRILISGHFSHLDGLVEKLEEEQVRRIVEAIISGNNFAFASDGDIAYVRDLGIAAHSSPLQFANPIYGEIIRKVK